MWLACALIILFSVGFVLPCMLDLTATPDSEFTVMSKGMWLLVAGVFWVFGSAAWLIVGRPQRPGMHMHRRSGPVGYGPAEAQLRHPAAQAAGGYVDQIGWMVSASTPRPLGPDDDQDFLLELGRRIREGRGDVI
jgi:hypothetical protein